jgi:hypothetical protein
MKKHPNQDAFFMLVYLKYEKESLFSIFNKLS